MKRVLVFCLLLCLPVGFSSLALGIPVPKPNEQKIATDDLPYATQRGQSSFYGAQYSPYSGPDFPTSSIPETVWYGGTSTTSGRPLAAVGGKWTWNASGWGGVPHSGYYLDGWTSRDNLANFDQVYFRRSQLTNAPCTPIAGNWSFWCGVDANEAAALCYAGGVGYGNDWNQSLQNTIALSGDASTVLEFDFAYDSEENFDYTYVEILSSGGWVALPINGGIGNYTGSAYGHEAVNLGPYLAGAGNYDIRFRFSSDGGFSDQDGLNSTNCGGLIVDNIKITETTHGVVHSCDAETGDGGWHWIPTLGPGDWAHLDYNPVLEDPCMASDPNWCRMADSVVVMYDITAPPTAPHRDNQDTWVISPVIPIAGTAGEGLPTHLLRFERYSDLPLLDHVFYLWYVKYFPYDCGFGPRWSPWYSNNTVYYSATKTCGMLTLDLSGQMPACAESAQIAISVLSLCAQDPWGYGCTYTNNKTPYFDNARFGAVGSLNAPTITDMDWDKYLDAFPSDGTLSLGSTARIGVSVSNDPTYYAMGDSLVVDGTTCSGSNAGMEVWLHFKVKPGPYLSTSGTWFTVYPPNTWHAARMDTAQRGPALAPGTWMGAFHEGDPNFGLSSGRWAGEGNHVLPNGLFTMGTHIEYYVSSSFTGSPNSFELRCEEPGYTGLPDDVDILPGASISQGYWSCQSESCWDCWPWAYWPCLLYVDDADGRGAQMWIEDALKCVPTNWDRYDKRAPTSNMKNGIGRTPGFWKGATAVQLEGYSAVLLDAYDVYSGSIERDDTNLFTSWLSGADRYEQRFLAISGNQVARNMNADATRKAFMNNYLGATYVARKYYETSGNQNWCVDIKDVAGNRIDGGAILTQSSLRASMCPAEYNIIGTKSGTSGIGETEFGDSNPVVHLNTVSNQRVDEVGNVVYRTVLSSYSIAGVRSPGCPGGANGWNFGDSTGVCGTPALKGWQVDVRDKLGWGRTNALYVVPGGPDVSARIVDELKDASPNPMNPSTSIIFSVKSGGRVSLRVYDASGRLVRTLVDSRLKAGSHKAPWDGRNDNGVKVGSGVFFYQIETEDGFKSAKKIVILK